MGDSSKIFGIGVNGTDASILTKAIGRPGVATIGFPRDAQTRIRGAATGFSPKFKSVIEGM